MTTIELLFECDQCGNNNIVSNTSRLQYEKVALESTIKALEQKK